MGGFQWMAWFIGYILVCGWMQMVYPQRHNRGYMARFQTKVVNKVMGENRGLRYWVFDLGIFVAILWPISIALEIAAATIFGIDISDFSAWLALFLRVLDDYLNGEDDGWKKRLLAAKNNVKWLWTPAMEPRKEWS